MLLISPMAAMALTQAIPAVAETAGGLIDLLRRPKDRAKRYLEEALQMQRDIPLPEFREVPYAPLPIAGQVTPEIYEAIIEGGPPTLAPQDPRLREAQLRSLLGMERVAREGLPLEQRLLAEEAQRAVTGEITRGQEAALANLARRGRAGGGTELAARMAAAGGQAEAARGAGADIARMGIERQFQAMREVPEMAGRMSEEDLRRAAMLSQMQQRYNEFISNLRTQAAANAARQRQQAQLYNVGLQQRVAEENVRRQTEEAEAANRLQQALFHARRQRAGGITGALEPLGRYEAGEESARRQRFSTLMRGIGQLGGAAGKAFAAPTGEATTPRVSTGLEYRPEEEAEDVLTGFTVGGMYR